MGRLSREDGVSIIDMNPARDTHSSVRSNCPDCSGRLTVLRIIPGRAASEYWTMRCVSCGGIHLDIVKTVAEPVA
jgi:uncharacterized Zn finger protein